MATEGLFEGFLGSSREVPGTLVLLYFCPHLGGDHDRILDFDFKGRPEQGHEMAIQGGFCRQKHSHRNTYSKIGPRGQETRPEPRENGPEPRKPFPARTLHEACD